MKLRQDKTKGKNVNGFLSAILSGILTEIIAGELLTPSYSITKVENGYSIYTASTFAVWQVLLILLGAFVSLWLLINYGIPLILHQLRKIRYQKTKTYTLEEIVYDFRNYSELVKTIYSDYLCISDVNLLMINSSVLFLRIVEIDNAFNSYGYDNIKQSLFRKIDELNTLKHYLSHYEFLSIIMLSETLINYMESSLRDDSMVAEELKDDCAKAKAIIAHFKEMVK